MGGFKQWENVPGVLFFWSNGLVFNRRSSGCKHRAAFAQTAVSASAVSLYSKPCCSLKIKINKGLNPSDIRRLKIVR